MLFAKIGVILFLCVAFLPIIALAASTYTPLVGIPGVTNSSTGNLPLYFNNLYKITIGIGALLAAVKLIMAGVKYSFSGIVTDKASAKSDIRGALLGLAILLVPFIVLNQIYPNLTNLNFLQSAGDVGIDISVKTGTPTKRYADTDPLSTEAPPGTTFEKCMYKTVASSPITGETDGTPSYTYDPTECATKCSAKGGTFTYFDTWGRCVMKAEETGDPVDYGDGNPGA